MKIKDILKKRKSTDYYARKYGYKIKDITLTKLKSDVELESYVVILINKGNRDYYKDWLSYRGSYDVALLLNKELKLIKVYTNLIFDVSFFADGKRIKFKKPKDIYLNDIELNMMNKSKETLVWND